MSETVKYPYQAAVDFINESGTRDNPISASSSPYRILKALSTVKGEKVNPSTGDVDLNGVLNTKSLIVLDATYTKVIEDFRVYTGMYRLRSQGETFEEALIELANITYYFYGDSRFGDSEQ